MENINIKTLDQLLKENNKDYPRTLNEFLEKSVEKFKDRPALSKAFETPITYKEFFEKVLKVADLLVNIGINKGDRVAILGENSPNWGISYFAIVRTGAIAVPMLPDFPEADIRHVLLDSEAKLLFTTQKQIEKVGYLDRLKLKHIITLDNFETDDQSLKIEPISNIIDKAIDFLKRLPETIGLKSKELSEHDIASIIYTSGTSGHSKAVMLTHKNLVSNVLACSLLMQFNTEDTFFSILPLSHTYEFTVGFLLALVNGARIVYNDQPPTPRILEKICKKEKPTIICSVPLILEKIYKKKVLTVLEKNKLIKLITKIPGLKKKIYKKVKNKLIEFFGGEFKIMAIGGASFNRDAEKFFKESGFPYLIGYGLTETAPLIAGGPWGEKTIKLGSTGKVTPGCEMKIEDADKKSGIGEICVRGPNVMKGYYKNPELTKEVLDEHGWFRTGDLGRFDKFENLHITGRSKNMILMSNGENIYPESIEGKINSSIYVVESLILENNGKLEAWVYLDYDLVDQETKNKTEQQRLIFIEEILQSIKSDVNDQLSSYSKISRVIEQKEPFIRTATHKIKRYLYIHSKK
jgi:long-chain acyl-CoA synthetase